MKLLNNNSNKTKTDYLPIWIYIGIIFGISFIMGFITIIFNLSNDSLIYVEIISEAIIFIIFIILYHKRLKQDFKKLTKKDLLYIITISIILIGLNFVLSNIFEKLNVNMTNQNSLNNMFINNKLLMTFYITLLAPVIEEIVFRYSIDTACKNNLLFLILSTVIFAIMHGIGIVTILYLLIGFGLS
jgi:membrane protease YdiL (CAAX protease family)